MAPILEFSHRVMRGSATEVVPVSGGFAVLNSAYPTSYEHNCLVVGGELDPATVMAEADRVLGGAGLSHRAIEVEVEYLPAAALDRFRAAGYEVQATRVMLLRRPPDRLASVAVERVSYDVLIPVVEAGWRRRFPDASEDSIRQLVERRTATARACAVTHHAVRIPEGLVARCDLYRINPIAQIETVETEPEWRNRGYARAVVLDAVELARGSGCSVAFLIADADDWPQELYRRLGFEPVGGGYTLQRLPAGAGGSPSAGGGPGGK